MEEETTQSDRSESSRKVTFARKEIVCKYFLTSMCRKGTACPYLHENDPDRAPQCSALKCGNPHCKFKHSVERARPRKECVYYNAGFCLQGKFCHFKHVERGRCTRPQCARDCGDLHTDQTFLNNYLETAYYTTLHKTMRKDFHSLFRLCKKCLEFGHNSRACKKAPTSLRNALDN